MADLRETGIDWTGIEAAIATATGEVFHVKETRRIGGGCINFALKISDGSRSLFLKLNTLDRAFMFAAEAEGLQQMASTHTVRVPHPITHGQTAKHSFLVLEWIDWGRPCAASERALGIQLARLHQSTQNSFGWVMDNTIGSTPQPNPLLQDGIEFLRDHRLGHQIHLARRKGARLPLSESLLERLPEYFESYTPVPSLLHGDLWSGNQSTDSEGQPVIYDPACYFGDREAEFGIIHMFGGFSRAFFKGYQDTWPLHETHERRQDLHLLYHQLNHWNLFGGGYLQEAESTLQRLLKK